MNKTKKQKLTLLIMVLMFSTLPIGLTSYCKATPTLKDVRAELKSLTPKEEAKLARTIVVQQNGIKIKDTFIPKTDSSELKVLTVRLTVYWARGGETDSDSRKLKSSTGYTLKQGESIAVDPRVIPYEKEVIIPNVGLVKAVDTGTAVKQRVASNGKLPVVDVFFVNRKDAENFANNNPKVVKIAVLN